MCFKTARCIGLLALTFALAAAASAAAQGPPLTRTMPIETIDIYEDEILPAQPVTLAARVAKVDAIVRGRTQRLDVRTRRKTDLPPGLDPKYGLDVYTEHRVIIYEVLKADPRLPAVGAPLQVVQAVGEAVVDGVRVRRQDHSFQQFAPGEEYVFFLNWDPSRECFQVLSSDAFRLTDGTVESPGRAAYARQSVGATKADFLTQLREAIALLK